MSFLEDYANERSKRDPEFKKEFNKANERLDTALLLMKFREKEGLSQRELAKKANVSKSTITKIETGQMNPTFKLMSKIVEATGHKLKYQII
ncbi:helix-turn-helix transcriptional regulator [Lactobacillus sp. ESL0791]|uniref:helix-turn-helix domain-containing protein n=1 Tax=Lactobacillus sp. ESL0791 TaxID=2983234 RepID=UPI0023F836C9|nr:helix-turn-helix transcriptional regulator [Lactobacillus sp. ESL0791]MDF7639780.1 helix-turn-helix transcriptional regulator [Lactobacillus sp. ESL0791]